ncbi:vesicle transport through interaction with t-SNAREs homolog 1A-like isoform X1 [Oscarella lobularis]|uniref:vesicle transport through interaction with t-SNAREs homolog 1A-like isoform X1 n=1 Tax=Oscarella lobularis TaxID=121494 RepID=UPI00331426CB
MSSVIEELEQSFGSLIADITVKTGKIPKLTGGEKQDAISDVERLLAEAEDLVDQIDIEAGSLPSQSRQKAQKRVQSYKQELGKSEKEFRRSRIAMYDYHQGRDELLGPDDPHHSEDQVDTEAKKMRSFYELFYKRAKLLDNTETLNKGSRRLEEGYKMALETEQIGAQIMDDLSRDRETIIRARERLKDTDGNLSKSSRVLRNMMRRVVQNRVVVAIIVLVLLAVIIVGIYFAVK